MQLLGNNILYIAFAELVELGVSNDTIRTGFKRKSKYWQSIKSPEDGRKVLIAYEPLGKKYKTLIEAKYGCPYQYVANRKREQAWEKVLYRVGMYNGADELRQYLRKQRHSDDGSAIYTDTYINEMIQVAAWFGFLNTIKGKRTAQLFGFNSKEAVFLACFEHWHTQAIPQLCSISNLRHLRRKLADFKKLGNKALLSKKHGNKNASKIGKQQGKFLLSLLHHHTKLASTQIHTDYNQKALTENWAVLSVSTVKNFVNQPAHSMLAFIDRHGIRAFRNKYELTVHRKKASLPHRMWVMDGSPMELFYNDGKSRYPKRVYAFVVLDVYSWAVVGVAFGDTETQDLVFSAIRNAGRHTNVLAEQLQFDNASAIKAHDMMAWYKKNFKYATAAKVGNAKAKVIEPWLKQVNEQVLRRYPNYAGAGVTAKRLDNKVNDEWVKANFDKLPNRKQVIQQLEEALFAKWNNRIMPTYGKSPNEMLREKENPQARTLELEDIISIFWKYRMQGNKRRTYQYTKDGIGVQVNNQKYRYEVVNQQGVPNYAFYRKNAGRSFELKYDPEDLSEVCLYHNDRQVARAKKVWKAPMAISDYQEGDGEKIQQRLQARRDFEEGLKAEAQQYQQETHAMDTFKGAGFLVNEAITDAESYAKVPIPLKGVQKDALNKAKDLLKVATIGTEPLKKQPKKQRKGLYQEEATFEVVDTDK